MAANVSSCWAATVGLSKHFLLAEQLICFLSTCDQRRRASKQHVIPSLGTPNKGIIDTSDRVIQRRPKKTERGRPQQLLGKTSAKNQETPATRDPFIMGFGQEEWRLMARMVNYNL
jgi:hypothetical protein